VIPSQVFRIILVDDEAGARATLRNLLAQYCPDTIVVGEAEGVESALALIPAEQADLLMLDVEMEDGTGFDLLDRLSKERVVNNFRVFNLRD
jgi:two-component system, LytTR family, response regulator